MYQLQGTPLFFKNKNLADQWNNGILIEDKKVFVDVRLKYILLRLAHFCFTNRIPAPVITSLIRNDPNSAHGHGRAADIRNHAIYELDCNNTNVAVYYWDFDQYTKVRNFMDENFFRTDIREDGRVNRIMYTHWGNIKNPNTLHTHISIPVSWKDTPWTDKMKDNNNG